MTGVEILATQEVATVFTSNCEFSWTAFAVVVIIGVFIGTISSLADKSFVDLVIGCIVGVVFGVIVGVGVGTDNLPTEYETRYKVTISDEVSINDFLERYEIIDTEGKIYTVRERD